jgi:hypothetical protein
MIRTTNLRTDRCAGDPRPGHPPMSIDKDVACELLRRSISFRHERLAVVRLCIAVHCGAEVEEEHWQYCRQAVAREGDEQLRELLEEATRYEKDHAATCH